MTAPDKKILWNDRDLGQRFSIVMGYVFVASLLIFGLIVGGNAALQGRWEAAIMLLPLALFVIEGVKLWRRRNAR